MLSKVEEEALSKLRTVLAYIKRRDEFKLLVEEVRTTIDRLEIKRRGCRMGIHEIACHCEDNKYSVPVSFRKEYNRRA